MSPIQLATQFTLITTFLLTLYEYAMRRGRERAEIALMFGSLAIASLVSALRAVVDMPDGSVSTVLGLIGGIGIVAHPYLMVRLVGQFRKVPTWIDGASRAGMVASWVLIGYLTVAYANVPTEARPIWPSLLVIAYFVFAEGYAAYGLVHGAHRASGIARKRLSIAAFATGVLGFLIFLAGVNIFLPVALKFPELVTAPLGFVSIAAFYLAFSTPRFLRRAWQLEELHRFLEGTAGRTIRERSAAAAARLRVVAGDLFGAEDVLIALRRSEGWTLEYGAGDTASSRETHATLGDSVITRVFASDARIIERDSANFTHADEEMWGRRELGGLVAVPVRTRERQWGVVCIRMDRFPLFAEETATVLALLADQTALALEMEAFSLEQEEIRLRELRVTGEELRRENAAIQSANRLKSEFLANMSHELRTPLNSIIGFTELIHSGKVGEPAPTHKEFLGDILTSSRHLLQLINDVLDMAKVESGRMTFEPEAFAPALVHKEISLLIRPLAEKKHITVTFEEAPELPEVTVDVVRYKQVLINYVSNAIKFTPEGGAVTVRAFPEGDANFRVEVADTGVGISSSDHLKLFQEFEQLDASMTKLEQGTGLGLALTKKLVEAQGGAVGVTSEVGRGSVFHAILPRVGIERATIPAAPRERTAGASNVLVVEDEKNARDRIARELAARGYNVDTASTLNEALARLEAREYDAVTLDLILPDGHGFEIIRKIRARRSGDKVAVVIVSRLGKEDVRSAHAVQDVLQKPVDGADLANALKRAGVDVRTRRRILVVDDDAKLRKLMTTHIHSIGLGAESAENGREALERIAHEMPAAIVLDLLMPEMDGFVFLANFRKLHGAEDVPVIVWTNKDLTPQERGFLTGSAQLVVHKGDGGSLALVKELQGILDRESP